MIDLQRVKQETTDLINDLSSPIFLTKEILQKRYQFLEKSVPSLFKMILIEFENKTFNKEIFNKHFSKMLIQLEQLQNKEITEQEAKKAFIEDTNERFIPESITCPLKKECPFYRAILDDTTGNMELVKSRMANIICPEGKCCPYTPK